MSAEMSGHTVGENKELHVLLWVVQGILALLFFAAGVMKLFLPMETLLTNMAWVEDVGSFVRVIGICEILGGLGMILPAATRIKPILTPIAGVALAVMMALAALLHVTRFEYSALGTNAVLAALAMFVAWGRIKKARIIPR